MSTSSTSAIKFRIRCKNAEGAVLESSVLAKSQGQLMQGLAAKKFTEIEVLDMEVASSAPAPAPMPIPGPLPGMAVIPQPSISTPNPPPSQAAPPGQHGTERAADIGSTGKKDLGFFGVLVAIVAVGARSASRASPEDKDSIYHWTIGLAITTAVIYGAYRFAGRAAKDPSTPPDPSGGSLPAPPLAEQPSTPPAASSIEGNITHFVNAVRKDIGIKSSSKTNYALWGLGCGSLWIVFLISDFDPHFYWYPITSVAGLFLSFIGLVKSPKTAILGMLASIGGLGMTALMYLGFKAMEAAINQQ